MNTPKKHGIIQTRRCKHAFSKVQKVCGENPETRARFKQLEEVHNMLDSQYTDMFVKLCEYGIPDSAIITSETEFSKSFPKNATKRAAALQNARKCNDKKNNWKKREKNNHYHNTCHTIYSAINGTTHHHYKEPT